MFKKRSNEKQESIKKECRNCKYFVSTRMALFCKRGLFRKQIEWDGATNCCGKWKEKGVDKVLERWEGTGKTSEKRTSGGNR